MKSVSYIRRCISFFTQWIRLLLLSGAFQSCLLISNYSILKRELKTYHCIIQPIIFIISILISGILWFGRRDENNKFIFDFTTFKYPINNNNSFANKYNLKCQYSSILQLQIDLIIQCIYTILLMIMFWYLLMKRYQYEIYSFKIN